MASTRLTKSLFYLSDAFAWILAALCFCMAIFSFVFGKDIARFDSLPISSNKIAFNTCIFALVGIGALALTRRKMWGLLAASSLASLGSAGFAIFYLTFVALAFGVPFVLVLLESRQGIKGET